MTNDSNNPDREERLNEALAEFMQQIDRGETVDRDQFLAEHPDLAEELRAYFVDVDRIERMAGPLAADTLPSPGTITAAVPPLATIRYFGDYELLEEIARGGMGVVYKARQVTLNRVVALKMILAGNLASKADVERFRSEAEAAAQLQHPNIVAIHEVGEHEGQHYFSMDYVEGKSLAEMVRENPLSSTQAAQYVKTVATAIQYAHEKGILHRDLKPSNVLIDRHDQPRVTDFGLAKRIEGGSDLTGTGQILGTPSYMPPEQASGDRGKVGPQSDVYALGAILYELLTGRPPFRAATPVDTLLQALDTDAPPPRLLNPKLPVDLETICVKCLQKNSQQRYVTPKELAEDLGRYLRSEPIAARPVTRRERAWRWCKRNPIVASLSFGLAVALFVGLAGVTWQWIRAERETTRALEHERLTRRYLASAHLNLVQQAIDSENTVRAIELLNQYRPTAGANDEDLRSFDWYYLWRQCHNDSHRFELTDQSMVNTRCVAVSPDARIIAVGGDYYEVHKQGTSEEPRKGPMVWLYDVRNEKATRRLWAGKDGERVESLGFSPDATTIAAFTFIEHGRRITVWDVRTGQQRGTIDLGIWADVFSLSNGGRFIAAADQWEEEAKSIHGVKIWELSALEVTNPSPNDQQRTSLRLCKVLRNQQREFAIDFAKLSPDGNRLAWRGHAGGITLSDLTSDDEPVVIKTENVGDVIFSPDGKYLATGSGWGSPRTSIRTVEIRNGDTGELRHTLTALGWVHSVTFSPDSRVLAVGQGPMVRLWDVESGRLIVNLRGHTGDVKSLAFDSRATSVVSVARSNVSNVWKAKVWDVATRYEPEEFAVGDWLTSAAISGDGTLLATRAFRRDDGWYTKVWDLKESIGREVLDLADQGPVRFQPESLAFGSGDLIAACGLASVSSDYERHFRLWNLKRRNGAWKAEVYKTVETPRNELSPVFSPDGTTVAYPVSDFIRREGGSRTYRGRGLALLDVATGQKRVLPKDPENWFIDQERLRRDARLGDASSIAFSPDGKRVASCHNLFLVVWDASTGEAITALPMHTGPIAFAPDGRTLAIINQDLVRLWDVSEDGLEAIRTKVKAIDNPNMIMFHGDAIEPITMAKAVARGHAGAVRSFTFCPDGKTLATASEDRTVRIWDVVTGEQRLTLNHPSPVVFVTFTPDGKTLISASDDGKVRLWRASTDDEVVAHKYESQVGSR